MGPFKEALEIKRKGSQACEATITLHMDWQPERFVVDPRLSELLNLKTATKAEVIEAFWGNVKRHRLQDPQQPQQINLPMELAQVWNARTTSSCVDLIFQLILSPRGSPP